MALGALILAAHLAVIAFNLLGLVAIPLGAALGWSWVRLRWWRLLHLVSWAAVALQAVLGRACLLTIWQAEASGADAEPLVMSWVNRLIYWDLPMWVFTVAYLALFVLVAALMWIVPPRAARRA